MYELFTAEAREAILEAQAERRALAADQVGTEHILLGLLRVPADAKTRSSAREPAGIGPRILADLGITLDRVRAEVHGPASDEHPGLTEDDAEALRSIGIDLNEVRRRLEETFGPGALDAAANRPRSFTDAGWSGPVFTPGSKRVMEVALRESLRLGHAYIGTEHLLLALAATDETSGDMLRRLGADPSTVRTRVLHHLGPAA